MEQTVLTCEQVDERDLEAGYVAGRLREDDATAFEAHFFGCDRCWKLLQAAQGVAAAERRSGGRAYRPIGGEVDRRPAPSVARGTIGEPRRRSVWLPPLAAAATLVLLAGGWWVMRQPTFVPTDTFRGVADSLVVQSEITPQGIAGHFGRITGADLYRVRAFSPSGDVLGEQESADTAFAIALTPAPGAALVQVTALDVLRQPLASSGLVPIPR